MNTIVKSHHRARRARRGFTLAELLVVISIMSILVAMLAPTVFSVMSNVKKEMCKDNISSIIKGALTYAKNDKYGRLPTIRPTTSNWGDMRDGNPGCLAILIEDGVVDRKSFLCPEARIIRNFEEMPVDANTFTYKAKTSEEGVSTLSYSFISMVYRESWKTQNDPLGNVAAQMTIDQVPQSLPVLADQNPRTTFDSQTVRDYTDLKDWQGNTLPDKLRRNSKNHKNKGQNVGRWDASVKWITDANNPNVPEDDIYTSEGGRSYETQGRRDEMDDAFLIP